ncbi:MAG: hypothetical protein II998_04985 [Clostridia bacterium]|nr:hypothetical protein [Clostridia bacterium]
MSQICVYDCLCQNCHIPFKSHAVLYNCVNYDIKNTMFDDFVSLTLNEVSCPHCNTKFTYEIPMVIISFRYQFAIKVNPAAFHSNIMSKQPPPFRFLPTGFKFREVYFMIEAVEKANIFSKALNDIYIEHFKKYNFSNEEALPFDEANIIYTHSDNDFHYFEKYDCNNNLIESLKKSISVTKKISHELCNTKWHLVNRLTINNFIEKGN